MLSKDHLDRMVHELRCLNVQLLHAMVALPEGADAGLQRLVCNEASRSCSAAAAALISVKAVVLPVESLVIGKPEPPNKADAPPVAAGGARREI